MSDTATEKSAMRKVYLRLLPLTMLMYFLCYIDRINVSFAALTMNKDIGLDAWTYGLSSSAFYLGYVVFEVPSNLVMDKVGARLWLARIMITWGLALGRHRGGRRTNQLPGDPFPAGCGEAGLFPGNILLFTYWFPDAIAPASSARSPWRCRSPSRSARRSPPRSSGWTACWASRAGSGSISWRRCRPC